jgi:hypothetical protein
MSGTVPKGALVSFSPTFIPLPIPNVIVFQYNPEQLTHTWTQAEPAGSAGVRTSNPQAVPGMPGESFDFTLAMDSNDDIANNVAPTAAIAEASGVYSRLAALEMLLYPTGTSNALVGAVTAAVGSLLGGSSSGPKRNVPQSVIPVTLFIWGPGRIVPVRVTALTITEKLYDGALNPTHVEAHISLRVLTPAELTDHDVLGNLATIAYSYTLTLRQTLALANLANAAESIIGMIPH